MSPPEIGDEKQSRSIDDSRGSARIVSLRESKQPFPPLPADGFATTMHDVPNNSYPGLDDSDMLSPTTDDLAEEEEDPDFHSSYSLDNQSFSDASMESDEEAAEDGIAMHHPFRQSSSSLHGPNAFAPPFYNRPPTPLPPSPSLTSLLRPPFSTTTSRPTTPDSSDVETPNDTEAAVAKSARRATTVPRASPKVPTYEYYGFVLYLASSLAFCESNPMRCRK
jgi:phosphatidylinositol glycan class P protein